MRACMQHDDAKREEMWLFQCVSVHVCMHHGAWLLPFPVWLQLGVRATLRSFLVDLFVPKIKLRERERVISVYACMHDVRTYTFL
jgi:hypothetical protein